MRSRWVVLAIFAAFAAGCGLAMSGAVSTEPVGGSDAAIGAADGGDGGDFAEGATIEVGGDGGEPSLPPSTPGTVKCGTKTCTAQTQFCCVGKEQCDGNPTACGTYREVYCDEPVDCPGAKCCLGRNSNEKDNASFRCASDCSSDSIMGVRVCRTSADCNAPAQCIARTCLGFLVGTCGGNLPPQCADGGL